MSAQTAFETGLLRAPLVSISKAKRDVYSAFSLLPGLRGFWPMGAINAVGHACDLSGNNELLVTAGTPLYNIGATAPYVEFDGSSDWLGHVDHALYDITGLEAYVDPSIRGITIGGWFWFNSDNPHTMIAKWSSETNQSYWLNLTGTDEVRMRMTADGSTDVSITRSGAVTLNQWLFVVGRFVPSTSVDVILNGDKASNVTSIPTDAHSGIAELRIGNSQTGTNLLDGRASMCFVSAAAIDDAILETLYQTTRPLFGV